MLIKWLREDDQLKHWLQWEQTTPLTVLLIQTAFQTWASFVFASKHTFWTSANITDLTAGDAQQGSRPTLLLTCLHWSFSTPFDFVSSFKECREQTALPTGAVSLNCKQAMPESLSLSLPIRSEQAAGAGGQAHTHTHSVYTVLFGLFSY